MEPYFQAFKPPPALCIGAVLVPPLSLTTLILATPSPRPPPAQVAQLEQQLRTARQAQGPMWVQHASFTLQHARAQLSQARSRVGAADSARGEVAALAVGLQRTLEEVGAALPAGG